MCCKTVLFLRQTNVCIFSYTFLYFVNKAKGKEEQEEKEKSYINTHVMKTYLTLKFYFHEEMTYCDAANYTLPKPCIIMSKCNTLFEQVQQDRSFFKNLK